MIEQFFSKGTRLEDKLSDEKFTHFYKENPFSIDVNREIDERKKRNAARKKRKEDHDRMVKQLAETEPEAI